VTVPGVALVSVPVEDDISSDDPVEVAVEYENGCLWLTIERLGVYLRKDALVSWSGGWRMRRVDSQCTLSFDLVTPGDVAAQVLRDLAPYFPDGAPGPVMDRPVSALSEDRMAGVHLALEVLTA